MTRNADLDVLRGLLLVMMTMTHLPTVWQGTLVEPLGYVSAAEGFVFLSAFLAGGVYLRLVRKQGPAAAAGWSWRRVRQLYLIHLVLLALAFTVVAWIADTYNRPAARNLLGYYFEAPLSAITGGALLLYRPPLLDILPLYILLIALTPLAMGASRRFGWAATLGGSAVLWLAAQFGLRQAVHAAWTGLLGLDLPLSLLGAFDLFAWQFLWVGGLWFGTAGLQALQARPALLRRFLVLTTILAVLLLAYRHTVGLRGGLSPEAQLFWLDKWTMSPLRILNITALIGALMWIGPRLTRLLPLAAFEQLGRASLWVFIGHLASLLFLLCVVGPDDRLLDGAVGLATLAAGFAALFAAAALQRRHRTRQATAAD